jgi:hypothetical protein
MGYMVRIRTISGRNIQNAQWYVNSDVIPRNNESISVDIQVSRPLGSFLSSLNHEKIFVESENPEYAVLDIILKEVKHVLNPISKSHQILLTFEPADKMIEQILIFNFDKPSTDPRYLKKFDPKV